MFLYVIPYFEEKEREKEVKQNRFLGFCSLLYNIYSTKNKRLFDLTVYIIYFLRKSYKNLLPVSKQKNLSLSIFLRRLRKKKFQRAKWEFFACLSSFVFFTLRIWLSPLKPAILIYFYLKQNFSLKKGRP